MANVLPAMIPDEQVIRIAKDMCAALELCKKHNIVHRDTKPQNIFVSENGNYKLGDFGIAKTVEKTMGGSKTGTYKYMAPEVYSNRPYNSTADIYSLGLVLYWLLNERRMPFMPLPPEKLKDGMDEESRKRRLSGERLPTPAHGSKNLKEIVLKACAFDPKDRYQTAREMREDLARLSGGRYEAPRLESDLISASDEEQTDGRTVGPVFDDVVDNDWDGGTVGPDFGKHIQAEAPTTQSSNKKIMYIAIAVIAIIISIFLFKPQNNTPTTPSVNNTPHTPQNPQVSVQEEKPKVTNPPATQHVHSGTEATDNEPETTEGVALQAEPKPLSEFTISSAVGKVWIRSTAPYYYGSYHTKADAPECLKDWSKPGYSGGTVRDNQGNEYDHGIHVDGWDSGAYYYEIRLDGKYTTFSGVCACPEESAIIISYVYDTSKKCTKDFEVYGDGELLFTSATMRYDYEPQPFSVDVTGVQVL